MADITEDLPYDLVKNSSVTNFTPTNIAYDLAINNLPFILKISNQTKYQRETADFKKQQFDNSPEPGEQSLSNWWIRSQTSFHNGAGIRYYEPAQDYQHYSHRFYDSSGIDVWTDGEISLLPEVVEIWNNGEIAGKITAAVSHNGDEECIIAGDNEGNLYNIPITGNATATAISHTLDSNHTSSDSFISVTSDGTNYYAMCDKAIHRGSTEIGASADVSILTLTGGAVDKSVIQYAKGYVIVGIGDTLYNIEDPSSMASTNHNSGTSITTMTNKKTHVNPNWSWNSITGGRTHIYASGFAGNQSEIWAIGYNDTQTDVDVASAVVVAELPHGEIINAIHFYLGNLLIGTNKGIRVATVNDDGSIIYGPLLYDSVYDVNGFSSIGNYVYAATSVRNGGIDNAVLVRIDLAKPFNDGTYAYAYDLQYISDVTAEASNVFVVKDRIVFSLVENGVAEIAVPHTTQKRASGWLETGYIRFNTVEKKFFRYAELDGVISGLDSISISTIDRDGVERSVASVGQEGLSSRIGINQPSNAQVELRFKFTLNNNDTNQTSPVLKSYQIKAIPATRRQRYIQYPLSCFDVETDRYNTVFGYSNRAYEMVRALETLEETGSLVIVTDYRTNERFEATIEIVKFENESSPDKRSDSFGGVITITVRKL